MSVAVIMGGSAAWAHRSDCVLTEAFEGCATTLRHDGGDPDDGDQPAPIAIQSTGEEAVTGSADSERLRSAVEGAGNPEP